MFRFFYEGTNIHNYFGVPEINISLFYNLQNTNTLQLPTDKVLIIVR